MNDFTTFLMNGHKAIEFNNFTRLYELDENLWTIDGFFNEDELIEINNEIESYNDDKETLEDAKIDLANAIDTLDRYSYSALFSTDWSVDHIQDEIYEIERTIAEIEDKVAELNDKIEKLEEAEINLEVFDKFYLIDEQGVEFAINNGFIVASSTQLGLNILMIKKEV